MAEAHNTRSKFLFPPQENGVCLLPVHKCMQTVCVWLSPRLDKHLTLPVSLAENLGLSNHRSLFLPSLPSPSLWHYLEERVSKPGETSEVIRPISSLTNEETQAQASAKFAAQDHRATGKNHGQPEVAKLFSQCRNHSSWRGWAFALGYRGVSL